MAQIDYYRLTSEVLERATHLIEQGHARNTFARNGNGDPVSPTNRAAVAFDAAGAVIRAADEVVRDFDVRALVMEYAFIRTRRARRTLGLDGDMTICDWNDHPGTTPAHIIGALEFAALDS